jgi:hypothetical protein
MMYKLLALLFVLPLIAAAQQPGACPAAQHPVFKIAVTPELFSEPVSARLIVMMSCLRNNASRWVRNHDVERSQLLGKKMQAE